MKRNKKKHFFLFEPQVFYKVIVQPEQEHQTDV